MPSVILGEIFQDELLLSYLDTKTLVTIFRIPSSTRCIKTMCLLFVDMNCLFTFFSFLCGFLFLTIFYPYILKFFGLYTVDTFSCLQHAHSNHHVINANSRDRTGMLSFVVSTNSYCYLLLSTLSFYIQPGIT